MNYTIRPTIVEDAEALLPFLKNFFAGARYFATQSDEFTHTTQSYREELTVKLAQPHNLILIAEINGKIVGWLSFTSKGNLRRIAHRGSLAIAVDPDFTRKGIGSALITRLIEWAKSAANPIRKIELGVLTENHAAIRLYEKFGFVREGVISGEMIIDGEKIDGLLMGLWVK